MFSLIPYHRKLAGPIEEKILIIDFPYGSYIFPAENTILHDQNCDVQSQLLLFNGNDQETIEEKRNRTAQAEL